MQFAASRVDCSVSALGIGLLLEDNESVYLAQQASASTIALQTIEDSLVLSEKGFPSGYYEDGSYLDHSRTPYTNSYGVVVIEGLSKIASILNKSPWQYDKEKSAILKTMMIESYGLSVYNGYALDMLRGRAVARKQVTDKSIGRDITTYVLLLMDALDSETQKTMKRYIKNWLIHDPEYINSLTEITQLAVRSEAKRLLNDTSVNTALQPVHRNFPLMDRVIHRSENWLFGLSMYSSRIFNCEIMNGENLIKKYRKRNTGQQRVLPRRRLQFKRRLDGRQRIVQFRYKRHAIIRRHQRAKRCVRTEFASAQILFYDRR